MLLWICGLALTNHHTIILLAPAVMWALFYYSRPCISTWPTIAYGLCAFGLGLAIYLYLPCRAFAEPYLNWDQPNSWSGLMRLLTRADYGSSTLMITQAETYDWLQKYTMYAVSLVKQFNPLGVLCAVCGMLFLLRQSDKKLAFILLWSFVSTSFLFISLANLPTDRLLYLAVFERFYMLPGVCVALFIGLGIYCLQRVMSVYFKKSLRYSYGMYAMLIGSLLISTLINYPKVDQSNHYILSTYGTDLLNSMEKNAIVVVKGDNNTFVLNYLQRVAGRRTDLIILTSEQLHFAWYVQQIQKRHPTLRMPTDQDGNEEQKIMQIIANNIDKRPIYFTRYLFSEQSGFYEKYRFLPMGLLNQVVPKHYRPNHTEYMQKNNLLWQQYDLKKATRDYAETSYEYELVQQYALSRFALGVEYTRAHWFDLAIEQYKQSIAIDPKLSDAYKNLGIIYAMEKHQPDQAVYFWKTYLQLNPADPEKAALVAFINRYAGLPQSLA